MKIKKPWIAFIEAGEETAGAASETLEGSTSEEETTDEPAEEANNEESEEQEEEPQTWDAQAALKKIRKINAENKRLRERTHAAEEKAKTAEETNTLLKNTEAENLRLRIALEMNLPEKFAMRLQGETREELLQDAQELIELYDTPRPGGGKPRNRIGEGHQTHLETSSEVDLDKLAQSFRR